MDSSVYYIPHNQGKSIFVVLSSFQDMKNTYTLNLNKELPEIRGKEPAVSIRKRHRYAIMEAKVCVGLSNAKSFCNAPGDNFRGFGSEPITAAEEAERDSHPREGFIDREKKE